MRRADSLDRFEAATAWPMLVLSVAIIPLLVIPAVVHLSPSARATVQAIDWFIWSLFAVEYVIRLVLAPRRLQFVRRNWIDLVLVAVPFLRPLRIVRSARALRLLRAARAASALGRGAKQVTAVLRYRKLNQALLAALAACGVAAVLVDAVERGSPDANITSIGDALWWAFTTVTTVGYGDRFPVTAAGRGIGVLLMLIGISLFGVLAASLAAFFVRDDESKDLEPMLTELLERVRRIEERLETEP